MPKAWSLIRSQPFYRADAFAGGLRAAGFEVRADQPRGAPGDVLIVWNRYGTGDQMATAFARAGGAVLVAENGYLGAGGTSPKFDVHPGGPRAHHYYAIARDWHNGRGSWLAHGPERFAALGVELKPWRTHGEHILIAPNRSFGVGEQVMHPDWAERAALRIAKQTSRPVRIRRHPGNDAPTRPLEVDLRNCWACVCWSSGAAVHSLAAGIPTYIEAPFHVMKAASASGSIEDPVTPERQPHFERMAWAQWTLSEIESGLPFVYLLKDVLVENSASRIS